MFSFTPFPEVKTERFLLRQAVMKDAPEIFLLRSSEEVNRFIDRPRAVTITDAENFIQRITETISKNEGLWWAIVQEGEEKMAGSVCLFNFSTENSSAEIGYELLPAYQGRGIMKEVIPAVINFVFNSFQLKKLVAEVWEENSRSIQLLLCNNFKIENKPRKTAGEEDHRMITYCLKNPFHET